MLSCYLKMQPTILFASVNETRTYWCDTVSAMAKAHLVREI